MVDADSKVLQLMVHTLCCIRVQKTREEEEEGPVTGPVLHARLTPGGAITYLWRFRMLKTSEEREGGGGESKFPVVHAWCRVDAGS